ncbi:MAG TPA: hypothetical protein VNS32_20580, partial [Flavisolibacter sp.]|nr:hypothetical protein [Flavisolibacter sp.]
MEIIDPDILVNKIIALWDAGIKDDATVIEKIQSEFQISENEAETVLELTQTGLFRAQIMSNGQGQKYPKSNLTKN